MTKITKTVVQVTILHLAEDRVDGTGLGHIAFQIDEGDWVGQSKIVTEEAVPDDKVAEELQALGNDGTFFEGY
jgi:hypothetical protein